MRRPSIVSSCVTWCADWAASSPPARGHRRSAATDQPPTARGSRLPDFDDPAIRAGRPIRSDRHLPPLRLGPRTRTRDRARPGDPGDPAADHGQLSRRPSPVRDAGPAIRSCGGHPGRASGRARAAGIVLAGHDPGASAGRSGARRGRRRQESFDRRVRPGSRPVGVLWLRRPAASVRPDGWPWPRWRTGCGSLT